jgi:hypothetical protein
VSHLVGISQGSRIQRCLSTHGCTATCSMQRSTPLCGWNIHNKRGPVQEGRSSRTSSNSTSTKSAMKLHEGLKDGGMELHLLHGFGPEPHTLAAAVRELRDLRHSSCMLNWLFHRVKQWPFVPTIRSPSSNAGEATFSKTHRPLTSYLCNAPLQRRVQGLS